MNFWILRTGKKISKYSKKVTGNILLIYIYILLNTLKNINKNQNKLKSQL